MSERKNYSRQISKSPRVPKHPLQSLYKKTDTSNSNARDSIPSSARTFNLSLDTCHGCYFPEPRPTPEYRISSAPPNFPFPSPKKNSKGEKFSKSERRKLKDLSLRNGFLMNEKFLKNPSHYTSDFQRKETSELQIPEEFYVLPNEHELQQIKASRFYFSNFKNKATEGVEKAATIGENVLMKKKADKGAHSKEKDHVKKTKNASESVKSSTHKEPSEKNKNKASWIHSRSNWPSFSNNLFSKKSHFPKHQRMPAPDSSRLPKQTPVDIHLNNVPALKTDYDHPLTVSNQNTYYKVEPTSIHVHTQDKALNNRNSNDGDMSFNSLYVRDLSASRNTAGNKVSHTSYASRGPEIEPQHPQRPDLNKEKHLLLAADPEVENNEYPESFIKAIRKHLRRSLQPVHQPGAPQLRENIDENFIESDYFSRQYKRKRKSRQRSASKNTKSLEADSLLESITETDDVIENRIPSASIVPASTNRIPSTDHITPDNKTTNIPNQKPLNLQTNTLPSTFPENEAYAQAKVKPTPYYKPNTALNQTSFSKQKNALPLNISGNQDPIKAKMKPGLEYKPTIDQYQKQHNMQTNASQQNISRNQGSERTSAKPNTAQNQKPLSIQSNVTPSVLPRSQANAQTKIKQPQNQIPFSTQTNVIPTNIQGNQDLTKTNVKPITQFKPNIAQPQKPLTTQSNVTPTVLPVSQDNAQAKMKQVSEYKPSISQNQNPPNAQTSIIPPNLPGSQELTKMNTVQTNQFKPNIPQNQKPLPMQTNVTLAATQGKQDNIRTKMKPASDYKSSLVTNQIPLNAQTNTLPSNFPKNQDPTQMPKKVVSDNGSAAVASQKSHSIPSNAYQSNIPESQDYTQAKMKPTTERTQSTTANQKLYGTQGSPHPTIFLKNQDPTQMQTKPASDYVQSTGLNQKPGSTYQTNIPESQDHSQAKMKYTTERTQSTTANQKLYGTQGSPHPTTFSRNQDPAQMQTKSASDYVQSTGLNQKSGSTYQTNIPESQDYTQAKMKPTTERTQSTTANQKPHSNQGSAHQSSFPENQYSARGRMKPASEYKPNIADIQNSYNAQTNVYSPNFPASQEPIKSSLKPTSQSKPNTAQGQKPLQSGGFPLTFSAGPDYINPNEKRESVSGPASKNFPVMLDNKATMYGQKLFDKQGLEHKPLMVDQNTKRQFFENRDSSQRTSRVYEKHAHSDSSNTPKSLSYQSDGSSSNPSQCSKCSSNKDAVKKLDLFSDSQPLFPENIKILSSKTSVRPENTNVEPTKRPQISKDKSYFPHYQRLTNIPDITSNQKPTSNKDFKTTNEVQAATPPPTWRNRILDGIEKDSLYQPNVPLQPQTANAEPPQKTQVADERRESNKPNFSTNRKTTDSKSKSDVPTKKKTFDKEVLKLNSSKMGRQNVMFQLSKNAEGNHHDNIKAYGHENNQKTELFSKAQPKNFNVYTVEYNDPNKALVRSIGTSLNEKLLGGQNFGFSAQRSKFIDANAGLQDSEYREIGSQKGSRLFVETGLPLFKPPQNSKTDLRNLVVYPFEYNDQNNVLVQKMSDALHQRHVDKVNILASVPNANFIYPNVGFQLLNPENGSQMGSTLFLESELPILITPEQSRIAGFFSNADPQTYGAYYVEDDGRNNALLPISSSSFYQTFYDKPDFESNAPNVYKSKYIKPNEAYISPNEEYVSPNEAYANPNEAYISSSEEYANPNEAYISSSEAYVNPNEAYISPNEAYGNLNEAYISPNEAYGNPNEAYLSPNEAYGNPNEAYLSPNEAYGNPNEAYANPNEAYISPNEAYGNPKEAYANPNEAYISPKEAYANPKEAYVSPNEAYGNPDEAYPLPGSQTSLEIITLSAWHPSRRVQSSETESLSPYYEDENSLVSTTATPLSLSSSGSQDLDYVAYGNRFGIEDSDSYSFGSSQSDFQDSPTGFSQSDFYTSDDLQNSRSDESALETESANLQPYPFGYSGPYGALSDEFGTIFCQKLSGTQVLECEVPELLFSGTESGSLLSEKSYFTLFSETLIPEPPLPIFDVPQTQKHSEFFGHNADFGSPGMQSQEHCSPLESSAFSSSRSSPDPYANSPTQTSTCFAPQNPYGMANQTFCMDQSICSPGAQVHQNTPVGRAFCPGRFTSAPEVPMNQSYVLPNTSGHASHLNQSYVVDQNRSSPGGTLNQTFGVGNTTGSPCPPQNQSYVVDQSTGGPCVAVNQTFGVGNNTGSPRPPAHQTFEIGQSYSSPCALLNQTFSPGNPCPTLNQTFVTGSASGSPCPNQTFACSPHQNLNQTYGGGNASGNPCANQTYGVYGPCGPAQQTPPGMQHDGAMIDPNRTVNVSQPFMNRIGSPSPGGGAGPIDPTRTFDAPVCKLPYKSPNFIRVERKKKELAFNASDLDSSDPDPYSPESGVEFFTPERRYQTSFMNSRPPCGNTSYYPSVSSSNESPVRASTFCIEYKDPYQSTPRPSLSAQDKNRFQPVGEDTGDDDLILDIISHHLSKLSTPSRGICTGRQEKSKCLPKEPPKKTPTRGRTLPKMPELTDEDICNLIQCEKEDVNSVSYLMSDARKVYKKPCPKQQKAQMNVQSIAKSITSRPTTSQSHTPDYGKSQASAIEPDPEDISPDLAANMMFSQEEGIELEGPPTKTVNYLFPESKESDQDKIAVVGSEQNEEENMVEKSPDVPEEGVSDSAYAKTMMIKGARSKGASYEMDVALGHEKREYVLVPKKPIRYNKIQYRGNLPTWFPGYFSSFPDDHGGIKLVSSPSQLLQKAWMWTAPLNLPPSDIIILD